MSKLLLGVRGVLSDAGYQMVLNGSSLLFEDASVLGILYEVETVEEMLSTWESLQDRFLKECAPRLIVDPLKAWNCYTVLLTSEAADPEARNSLLQIEEDFRGSRKIIRADLATRAEIETALAPLIPLRRVLSLVADDVKKRLLDRLGGLATPLAGLLTDLPANRIATAIMDAS